VRIEQEVAALGDLPREELAARWMKIYGCPPPRGVKRGLLERAVAWHLQAKYLGGLSPMARKAIREAVKLSKGVSHASAKPGHSSGNTPSGKVAGTGDAAEIGMAVEPTRSARRHSPPQLPSPTLRPGTRLVREWNGRVHVVDVSEKGFVFDGKTYRSLSAIAKRITGAHWSGPRFFGL
jgi:hypothetical protein